MPPTSSEPKPKSSKRRTKAVAKPKLSHAEQMRVGSIHLTAHLNAKMAKDDRRRAAAHKEPLMQFVLPDDFFSRPRMFGYEISEAKWKEYAKNYRRAQGESEEEVNGVNSIVLLTNTFFLLRSLSGIKYLEIEWGLPEDFSKTSEKKSTRGPCTPSSNDTLVEGSSKLASASSLVPTRASSEDSSSRLFPVLMLFMVTRYRKILKRPTQKQVDILSAELGCEPKWYVDAEEDDL